MTEWLISGFAGIAVAVVREVGVGLPVSGMG